MASAPLCSNTVIMLLLVWCLFSLCVGICLLFCDKDLSGLSSHDYIINAVLKSKSMGTLIKRIPGSRIFI